MKTKTKPTTHETHAVRCVTSTHHEPVRPPSALPTIDSERSRIHLPLVARTRGRPSRTVWRALSEKVAEEAYEAHDPEVQDNQQEGENLFDEQLAAAAVVPDLAVVTDV